MDKKTNHIDFSEEFFVKPKTREEIISEISESTETAESRSIPKVEKKTFVIPSLATKANFEKIAKSLNIEPGSKKYGLLKFFCEEKKASTVDSKMLIQRIENWSDEQLEILKLICIGKSFTAKNIVEVIPSIKKFGIDRLLALRAFVDLEDLGPGPLNLFFLATLPQGKLGEMGKEAYENEIKEKMMSLDQVNVFYNICYRIPSITHRTAIAVISKTRQLKQQHAQVINTFLKEDVSFGDKPISNDNILGLINLWLTMPELDERKKLQRLIKKLSRKSNKKKKDFQFLILSFREEAEKGKKNSLDNIVSGIRSFLG